MPPSQVRRVLMSADAVGGVLDYALELSRALSRAGVAVTLAVMGPKLAASRRREAARIGGLDLHAGDFPLEWMANPEPGLARAGNWLLDLERMARPDIVHLNHYCHAALPWRTPCLVVAHSCVLTWWRAVHGENAPEEWVGYARRVTAGLAATDSVVAPTRAFLETIRGTYGLAGGQAIWNGRSNQEYRAGTKQPFVLAAGRAWDKGKNLATLDDAARGLSWPVLAAGPLSAPDGSRAEFETLIPLGPLDRTEMRARLAEAAIFAAPALYEPFGLAILEAALSGCALVLGDIPTLRDLWDGAALFVPPRDADQIREGLETLIVDSEMREAMARLATERAQAYSVERMTASYLDLYGSLAGAPARVVSCAS